MATAWGDEYIEFSYGLTTFLIGSRAVWCGNPSGLDGIGASIGENLRVAGADGTLARNRYRGEMYVDLVDVHCDGSWNDAGGRVTANLRANAKTHLRSLLAFLDGAPGRQMTITWHEGSSVEYQAPCQFEEHSVPVWEGPSFVTLSILITVNTGRLELVPE